MKKAIVLFLLCLLFSQSYSQFNLLEEAYKKKSKEKLNEFFIDWQKETIVLFATQHIDGTSSRAGDVFASGG